MKRPRPTWSQTARLPDRTGREVQRLGASGQYDLEDISRYAARDFMVRLIDPRA